MPKAMSIPLTIKHAAATHDLVVDLAQPGLALKRQIHELTGVPLDRMKVMVKGGLLKDDADLAKLAFKPKQTVMVVGAAGPLPEKPTQPTVFLEDMDDGELALATRTPAGLVNLGNTCYFAASAQALRSIPSLTTALASYTPRSSTSSSAAGGGGGSPQLAGALKALFAGMAGTTEGFAPYAFLTALRQVAPQFAELSRAGGGFAQQDADECWTTMTNALRAVPGSSGSSGGRSWVEEHMMGSMVKVLTCDEAPSEPATELREPVPKLDCTISIATNDVHAGILDSLDQKVDKHSAVLGRTAVWSQKSRLERLPDTLVVHLVRFYWRRDTSSKAKIMRRVKFSHEYDVLELCTDALRAKLAPVNAALRQVTKDREERARIRRRTAGQPRSAGGPTSSTLAPPPLATDGSAVPSDGAGGGGGAAAAVYTGTAEEEAALRAAERARLELLLANEPTVDPDPGANKSGLYELAAIVTHKGASADAGHYIGWVKKQPSADDPAPPPTAEQDEQWHKFDDDRVSLVGRDRIGALEGGGEDSAAYILVYRSKTLD